jgi:hypothetical protein
MIPKELILNEVERVRDEDLDELYSLVKNFVSSKEQEHKESIFSKLKRIKIEGPADFAENLDLYLNGEKDAK